MLTPAARIEVSHFKTRYNRLCYIRLKIAVSNRQDQLSKRELRSARPPPPPHGSFLLHF
jgi:hypothetical protein